MSEEKQSITPTPAIFPWEGRCLSGLEISDETKQNMVRLREEQDVYAAISKRHTVDMWRWRATLTAMGLFAGLAAVGFFSMLVRVFG